MRQWTVGLAVALLLMAGSSVRAAVTVSLETYHGWSGAYRLSNGTVDLVFVPQIGRIMRYGYVGERNVLWENAALAGKTTVLSSETNAPVKEWQNYGGDKIWPAPQSAWGWPPDPISDSGPHTVSVMPNKHLYVKGPWSLTIGVRFEREISMDPFGTSVTIRNVLIQVWLKPATWAAWEVAQVDDPDATTFAFSPRGAFPDGYKTFSDQLPAVGAVTVQDGTVTIQRRANQSGKIGTRSAEGWIESRWGGLRFRITGEFPKRGNYPDGGCSQEIYTSDDPNRYVEMELLSPIRKIHEGAASNLTTHWSLTR